MSAPKEKDRLAVEKEKKKDSQQNLTQLFRVKYVIRKQLDNLLSSKVSVISTTNSLYFVRKLIHVSVKICLILVKQP